MYLQSNNEHKWIIEMNEKRNVKRKRTPEVGEKDWLLWGGGWGPIGGGYTLPQYLQYFFCDIR